MTYIFNFENKDTLFKFQIIFKVINEFLCRDSHTFKESFIRFVLSIIAMNVNKKEKQPKVTLRDVEEEMADRALSLIAAVGALVSRLGRQFACRGRVTSIHLLTPTPQFHCALLITIIRNPSPLCATLQARACASTCARAGDFDLWAHCALFQLLFSPTVSYSFVFV